MPKISASTVRTDSKGKAKEKVGGLPYGIEREVVIMKLIEHPNIMKLYDVWENKGELYLVLEYIEGGELFDYLVQRGRLEESEAVDYIHQILGAVDYCHRFNICHRDLKPENLLLDKNKNIKVADFGMAALEPAGSMLKTSCGSPHYASPEIIAGKTYHGGPSDIWSCGIILFALLTGHLPFDDENIHTLLLKVKTGHFVMPPDLSIEAKDLIWRMLELDPLKRIQMAEILDHPLLKKHKKKQLPRMPRAPTYEELSRPVQNVNEIDREILKNLQTLWRGTPREVIMDRLLAPERNTEKTFYCLLLKYRHDRLENYAGDDEARPRMAHSQSRKSLKSMHSRKSASSRRAHRRTGSKASRVSATSSHRRGVSFGKKKNKEVAPALPREMPIEQPLLQSTPKRRPPISASGQQAVDESTRNVSAEFSNFLDIAFNSKAKVTILADTVSKPLPSIPLPVRPSSAEPTMTQRAEHKQRAHKSAEVAPPLARIFEEEKERFADAEEENRLFPIRGIKQRSSKTISYPAAKRRPALGELDANQVTNAPASAAAAAMRHWPLRQETERKRVTSMIETPSQSTDAKKRFVSAPVNYSRMPSDISRALHLGPAVPDDPAPRKSWFGRTFSLSRDTKPKVQASPPGHPAPNTVSLAARRAAPPPPRLHIPNPFPHPSTFTPSSTPKTSFLARLLGVKPTPRIITTTHQLSRLQRDVVDALKRWERNKLGVTGVEENKRTRTVRATLSSKNALGLKSTKLSVCFTHPSCATFTHLKGSNSSFNRVVDEFEQIFETQGVLCRS